MTFSYHVFFFGRSKNMQYISRLIRVENFLLLSYCVSFFFFFFLNKCLTDDSFGILTWAVDRVWYLRHLVLQINNKTSTTWFHGFHVKTSFRLYFILSSRPVYVFHSLLSPGLSIAFSINALFNAVAMQKRWRLISIYKLKWKSTNETIYKYN